MSLLRYCLREGWLGIRRNPFLSLATVFTAAVAVFVLALSLLGAANLNNLIDYVGGQVQVSFYLQDEVTPGARDALIERMREADGVTEATYVSREDALGRLREQMGPDGDFLLEGIEEFNPLRDGIEVQVQEADVVTPLVEAFKDDPLVADVNYARQVVAQLVSGTRVLRLGILALAGLLGLATLFLTQNSVQLGVFARREEVAIMRLVGATPAIIRWPFVFEGMVLAGLGGVLAAAAATAIYHNWIWRAIGLHLAFLPMLGTAQVMSWLAPVLVVTGVVVGALGAVLALRRWLRE